MRTSTLLSVAIILIGCSTITGKGSETVVPLQELFDLAPVFDQKQVCSTGFLMIDESIAVYPTKKQANDERYQEAAILLFEEGHSEAVAGLSDLQKVSFCGKVDLLKKCWQAEGTRSFCVPFSKPIDVRVNSFKAAD